MKAILLAAALLGAASGLRAQPLGLDAYLDQVRQGDPQLRSARALDAAYALQAKQPLTAFSPQLSAVLARDDDQSVPALPAFSPEHIQSTQWGVGLGKLFDTGTYVDLSYAADLTAMGFPAAMAQQLGPLPPSYGQQLSLTVAQPLWRNWMAAEVQAAVDAATAGADASRAGNRYGAQAQLFQARQAYIQLCTVRQVILIQQESLKRNQKILQWTQAKVADNLADKVDVLQVQAAIQEVALGLSQNREDEAKDRALFNTFRGVSPDAVVEDLDPLAVPAALPAPVPGRQDLLAAQAALKASDAMVRQVEQSFTPDLSVFATLGLNARQPEGGPTTADLWQAEHPERLFGVKFTANLDWPLYHQVLAGARRARGSGEALVEDKRQQVAKDWENLHRAWEGMQERLGLARQLEVLQREKADREKVRYQDGRTTDFQVLRFEDDYNLSRVQTLQLTALANVLEATARYYNAEDQPW